jgi:integral membrane protein TerC family protein
MWRELHAAPQHQQQGNGIAVEHAIGPRLRRQGIPIAKLSAKRRYGLSWRTSRCLWTTGAAREHQFVLAFGLLLSIALMGIAADLIAWLLQKRRWIAYVGLAIILYVACEMIYHGAYELKPVIGII